MARSVAALPNTHAAAISTWDARASSVAFGVGRLVSGSRQYATLSYSANFSSTSGLLSAQFGAHYASYRPSEDADLARGASAGGVALFTIPMADRFPGGIPRQSLSLYVGGVPTALLGKQRNFVSIPLVLGVGLPYSPSSAITLTPWAELSPSLNFDTSLREVSTRAAVDSAIDGTLTRDEVEALIEEGLEVQGGTGVGKRAGLAMSLHLGLSVDFDVNVVLGAGGGGVAMTAGLAIRWDDQVPGVTGGRGALERSSCQAVEARFRSCPAARRYVVRPEEPPTPRQPDSTPTRLPADGKSESSQREKPRSRGPTEPRPPSAAAPSETAPSSARGVPPLQPAPQQ